MTQTALDAYLDHANAINSLTKKINDLTSLRSTMLHKTTPLLKDVIKEGGYLSDARWDYKTIEQNEVIFTLFSSGDSAPLEELINADSKLTYIEYDFERSSDNDHVTLSLLIGFNGIELHIHRDHIYRLVREYHLVNIFTDVINAHITLGKDINDILTSTLCAVEDARLATRKEEV